MKQLNRLRVAILPLFFSSCGTVFPAYTPNVPFLKDKGDAQLSGSGVVGKESVGANVQAAYSPAHNFYMSTNISLLAHAGEGATSSLFELGLGYYGKSGESVVYEISGGAGLGAYTYAAAKDNMSRFSLQGVAAFSKERFEFGAGIKAARTAYKLKESSNPDREYISVQEELVGIWSFEPFVIMRVGGPKVKFQALFSYPKIENEPDWLYPDPTLSLGISVRLGKK